MPKWISVFPSLLRTHFIWKEKNEDGFGGGGIHTLLIEVARAIADGYSSAASVHFTVTK